MQVLDGEGNRAKEAEEWEYFVNESFELVEPSGITQTLDGRLCVSDSGSHCVTFGGGLCLGGRGTAPGEFNTPRGICIAGEKLYVADSRNDRVQVLDLDGKPLFVIGSRGTSEGHFLAPLDVAVDAEENVYVADSDNHRVQKFDSHGAFLKTWGDFGSYPGQFASPTSLDVVGERVYVVDRENHRVQVFDREGAWLYEMGVHALLPREGQGKIHYPDAVAVSADGTRMLVCEGFENRAQIFGIQPPLDPNEPPPIPQERNIAAHYGPEVGAAGNLIAVLEPGASTLALFRTELPEPVQITSIGIHGTRSGELLRPYDAAIDLERKRIHVSDPANARLSTYAIVGDFEGELKNDPYLLAFARSLDFVKLHELGKDLGARWLIEPEAIALDAHGRLYVCDPRNLEVWIVDADFKLVGKLDTGTDPFVAPAGVAVHPDGRVFVVDRLSGRVRVFGTDGRASGDFARDGLIAPSGLAVDHAGRVWVSDRATAMLACYSAEGALLERVGAPGLAPDQYFKPRGLAVDGRGELVVLDWGNHRGVLRGIEGDSAGRIVGWFGSRLFTRELREQKR
ncbi:MAG: NHL repeat-containing protein [Planctomycetes bacterium]|nr:NHL repeat-containing protein [Planctomycetota bacterium]